MYISGPSNNPSSESSAETPCQFVRPSRDAVINVNIIDAKSPIFAKKYIHRHRVIGHLLTSLLLASVNRATNMAAR